MGLKGKFFELKYFKRLLVYFDELFKFEGVTGTDTNFR